LCFLYLTLAIIVPREYHAEGLTYPLNFFSFFFAQETWNLCNLREAFCI
jgi:hypothetical protein